MFRKLISNLPFNPGLLGQVNFYAQRIKQEEGLRRLGFGFMALALLIQMFAVMAPPEKSLAYSNDYIINGLRTRDDILHAWDGKTSDRNVADIYGRFGITRNDIERLTMYPNVTMHSNYADYWTIGRTSLSAVGKASSIKQQYKNSEVPVNYGSGSVYLRQLRAWDIVNPYNKYQAFEGWKDGKQFWILVDCGNLTMVGKPPILKNPSLQLRKSVIGGSRTLKPGDTFQYRIEYRNSVRDSLPVEDAVLTDQVQSGSLEIVSRSGATLSSGGILTYNIGNIPYSEGYRTLPPITVRLKQGLKHGLQTCNTATLKASNVAAVSTSSSGACVTVSNPPPKPVDVCPNISGNQATVPSNKIKDSKGNCINPPKPDVCPNIAGDQATVPSGKVKDSEGNCIEPPKCPLDSSISPDDDRCVAPALTCILTDAAINRTTKTVTLRTKLKSSNEYMTSVASYIYDFGDKSAKQTKKSGSYTDEVSHKYEDGNYTATVVVNYTAGRGSAQTAQTVACSAPIESEPDQPLSQEKTARNLTQDLNETQTLSAKAKAGDTIEYSLITHNSYEYDRANINVSDYIGDILDYSDLDMAFLTSQGGSFDENGKTLSWKPQTVGANRELINKFRIKLKDPIPSTNQPSAMTTAFDCQLSNKFGDQLDIKVDCPIPKQAEYVIESLPNTGPGTSLIIGFTATSVFAYFFARSRLLGKELELIRTDFAQTGGV